MIESFFRDLTVSWIRIVNGIKKFVTETSQEIPTGSVQLVRTGELVANAKPRPKPTVTLSTVSVPIHASRWIDIDPALFNEGCLAVSKLMIRLLRHETSIRREKDGSVRFEDLIEKFKVEFVSTLGWTLDAWVSFLAKGGGPKKRFQYCLNAPSSKHFLYFRASQ